MTQHIYSTQDYINYFFKLQHLELKYKITTLIFLKTTKKLSITNYFRPLEIK
jgi:hypothetical protein